MPYYTDPPYVDDNGSGTSTIAMCTVCLGWVPNSAPLRAIHDAFHASAVTTAATGMQANSSTIGVGAAADIVVPLNRTMPTSTYAASPMLLTATPTLLGSVSITGITTQTRTSVTVRVKNAGLSALSANSLSVGVVAVG